MNFQSIKTVLLKVMAYLGGALAWTAHLMISFWFGEAGCLSGWNVTALFGVLSVLALFVSVLAIGCSWILRNRAPSPELKFLGTTGLCANIIFLGIILVQVLPIFYLADCRGAL